MCHVIDDDIMSCDVIIDGLRRAFGLEGCRLETAVRACVARIVEHGAQPLRYSNTEGGWARLPEFGDDAASIADTVIKTWRAMRRIPEVGEICWFATPQEAAALLPG